MKNPGDTAAAVSLSVEGPNLTNVDLFAYGLATPPSTAENASECLASAQGFTLTQPAPGPSLSSAKGKGLVIPAHGSAFVLLATAHSTGGYILHATTDTLAPAVDIGAVTIPASAGAQADATLLVSGRQRAKDGTVLPPLASNSCGARAHTIRGFRDNFGYLEVKNPGSDSAVISVSVEGPNLTNVDLLGYTSETPPSTAEAADQCLVSAEGFTLTQPAPGPSFSAAKGNGLAVPAHGSVFVLLATAGSTGSYTLHLTR